MGEKIQGKISARETRYHEKINLKISGANASYAELSPEQKLIYNHIKKLLNDYCSVIFEQGGKGERDRLDMRFKQQYRQQLLSWITKYKEDFGENVDIDGIISEVLSDGARVEVIKQVKELVKEAIDQIGQIKVEGHAQDAIEDTKKAIENSEIDGDLIENTIKNIISTKQYSQLTANLKRQSAEHTQRIITAYRKNLLDKIFTKSASDVNGSKQKGKNSEGTTQNQVQTLPFQPRNTATENNRRWFGKRKKSLIPKNMVRDETLKSANSLVDKLYKLINYGLLAGAFMKMGQILASIYKISSTIMKHACRFAATVVQASFQFVGKFIFRPLIKMITAPITLAWKLSKGILANVVKYTKMAAKGLAYVLMTPAGMYALGFLLGFIWERVKSLFKGKTVGESVKTVVKMALKLGKAVFGRIMKFIEKKFPRLFKFLSEAYENGEKLIHGNILDPMRKAQKSVADFWEAHGGVSGILDEIGEKARNIINPTIEGLKKGYKALDNISKQFNNKTLWDNLKALGNFLWENKGTILSVLGVAWTLCQLFTIGGPIATTLRFFLKFIPAGKWGLITGLALGAGVWLGNAVGESILGVMYGIDKSRLHFAEKQMNDIKSLRTNLNALVSNFHPLLSEDKAKNLLRFSEIVTNEEQEMDGILKTIYQISRYGSQSYLEEKGAIVNELSEFIKYFYSSPFAPRRTEQDLRDMYGKGDTKRKQQINLLLDDINKRMENVANLVNTVDMMGIDKIQDVNNRFIEKVVGTYDRTFQSGEDEIPIWDVSKIEGIQKYKRHAETYSDIKYQLIGLLRGPDLFAEQRKKIIRRGEDRQVLEQSKVHEDILTRGEMEMFKSKNEEQREKSGLFDKQGNYTFQNLRNHTIDNISRWVRDQNKGEVEASKRINEVSKAVQMMNKEERKKVQQLFEDKNFDEMNDLIDQKYKLWSDGIQKKHESRLKKYDSMIGEKKRILENEQQKYDSNYQTLGDMKVEGLNLDEELNHIQSKIENEPREDK